MANIALILASLSSANLIASLAQRQASFRHSPKVLPILDLLL
nr:MAG TPA: hypothetical protein [Caudoviricetes sp.]